MEYGIIVAAVTLFGTFALVLADVTSEPESPVLAAETAGQEEKRLAA